MSKKVHLRLAIDIDFIPNGESVTNLVDRLNTIPAGLAGEGQFSGDSDAEVDSWSHKVEEIKHHV